MGLPLPMPTGMPRGLDPIPSGWSFLCNYTRKAIRNDEARRGPLPGHEDVVQQVYLEWRQLVGPGEETLANLLEADSLERQALRAIVPRVIGRARYEHNRWQTTSELIDSPAPLDRTSQDWRDLQIDVQGGAGNVRPRERRILELRGQGETFEKIGEELQMSRQRVCEAFNATLDRLRELYSV
jgi:hypothetical protein